jgi:hypothetical protein
MIRLMAPDTMNIARDVFGNTFGIGTRNLPPRKGMPRKVLQMGNILDIFCQKRKPSNYLTLCTFTRSLWNVMFRLETHEITFGTPVPKGISWS